MSRPGETKVTLTQERVRELLNLNVETGVMTRRVSMTNRIKVGDVVGCSSKSNGYLKADVDGKRYYVHHLVWLYVHGYFPEHDVDHIDRNPLNNAPSNLREVSRSCNLRNAGLRSDNISGVKGVKWYKRDQTWQVSIGPGFKNSKFLGRYRCLIEAAAHRYAAETCLNWNDCDANSSAYQYLKQQGIIK